MLARIFDVIDHDRKIQSIKWMRDATGLGVKESKDIVDELFQGRSDEGIEVRIRDDFTDEDFDAFDEWFDYDLSDNKSAPKGTLKLFRVVLSDDGHVFMSVVLSTSKPRARASVSEEIETTYNRVIGQDATSTIQEITSFKNGQVLLTSRL